MCHAEHTCPADHTIVKVVHRDVTCGLDQSEASTGKIMDAAQIILLSVGIHYIQEVELVSRRMSMENDIDAMMQYSKKQAKNWKI